MPADDVGTTPPGTEPAAPNAPASAANAVPTRRDVLRLGALAGLSGALGLAGCASGERRGAAPRGAPAASSGAGELFRTPPMERVRIGFVGLGGMGSNHINHLLKVPGAEILALCDVLPEKVARVQDQVEQATGRRPAGYARGPRDFERLCAEEDLDIVYHATPWEWHVPGCIAAMKNGKHAAVEVPAAYTLDGCWELVETAETQRKHCVMLENCCYDRTEMMILNMVRKGLLGELLHAECGYLHDLRDVKFNETYEGYWRRAHSTRRNGNLYPTHGLGPIAQCLDINRGDRFDYLVSMSSPSRGLQLWQQERLQPDDPRRRESFVLGDVNVSLIKTANGRTVYVVHDTNVPRPYSRIVMVQGTRGLVQGYPGPARAHIEGRSPAHRWENLYEQFADDCEHPLWRKTETTSATSGHGGMDFLENYRLVQCLLKGEPLDMDVYDAAAISAVCELSEQSTARRSRSVDFPDFTRGRWAARPPLGVVAV
ncbi:MAG: Gfo/Idh/MocA family protein [Phycisphaerae bacterium]